MTTNHVWLCWLALSCAVGCSGTGVGGRDGEAPDGAPIGPADQVGSLDGGDPPPPGARCGLPRLRIPTNGTVVETCSGTIAAQTFDHAICSCTDITFAGSLTTRSFDSRIGVAEEGEGAPVGVNGSLLSAGFVDIGGTFAAAAQGTLSAGATNLRIGGDAFFGSDLLANELDIARDAWVDGTLFPSVQSGRIGRNLHLSTSAQSFPGNFFETSVGGTTTRENFDVSPPCACGADEILDVGALVDDARTNNDNASIGLATNALRSGVGGSVDVTLPCGRYFVDGVESFQSIRIRVEGRAALFVDGGILGGSSFVVDLAQGAELDLFVKGDIVSFGEQNLGDPARPAALRMFASGGSVGVSTIAIAGSATFSGNLYAPRADVIISGSADVRGSIFSHLVTHAGDLRVLYDRAIIEAGESCDAPAPPAGACTPERNTCPAGQACVAGTCAGCGRDADCQSPLVCYPDGTCGALLF